MHQKCTKPTAVAIDAVRHTVQVIFVALSFTFGTMKIMNTMRDTVERVAASFNAESVGWSVSTVTVLVDNDDLSKFLKALMMRGVTPEQLATKQNPMRANLSWVTVEVSQ